MGCRVEVRRGGRGDDRVIVGHLDRVGVIGGPRCGGIRGAGIQVADGEGDRARQTGEVEGHVLTRRTGGADLLPT